MTDEHFDELLKQALVISIKRDWIDTPIPLEIKVMDTSRLDKKMAKLDENPTKYIKALRSAAAILLVISMLFGAAMLHPEARAWVRELIVKWFGDHNEYSYSDKYNQPVNRDWTFGYIPEGFELVLEDRNELECYYEYHSADGSILTISISGGAGTVYIDNEHHEISTAEIGNDIADIYISTDSRAPNCLIWHNSLYDVLISIESEIEIEELIKIAESIVS